ncbi:MAG TPA: peptidase T [Planctomycetota bacterium]|jgi:tripeptide aminopeptidase|nr:peptidase T [Planctomycetota bacterium]OQC21275.1 MAG: Peptidase T [Planctomycetes bacterium ADurb.Bin069]NMD36714.1 peptidase T [Planctomycetota bacterium]HNR99194.1 peptidase T [Planctomycetota bacterium]HNU25267.1 peptidase T [Planctomycetota bacterium]
MARDTLLDRFLRYVKIDTQSVEDAEDYPSSPGQRVLGERLAAELRDLGLPEAGVNADGIVTATIPATVPRAPAIAWLAHLDTSPESSGKNVVPVLHAPYDGGDITLPGDKSQVIRVDETPGLAALAGKTIITSDGTTLLGADDKAGIAVIMTAAAELARRPKQPRGPIRIVFTCDEEIGRGCDRIDPRKIDAACAYTLDGEGAGLIENETFSADLATVTITGKNIHPGFAAGKMRNAVRIAARFLEALPWQTLAPETTAGRDGFMHPYVIEGGVPAVAIKILLRSFATAELAVQARLLRTVARGVAAEFPGAVIDVAVKKQYRNMREHLAKEPRAVALAVRAVEAAGLAPELKSVRGGTDGSRLSAMGLPTPNLSVGMHNFHSKLEFACLEQMQSAVRVLLELARLWSREKPRRRGR